VPDFFRPKAGSADVSMLSLQMSMIAVGIIAAFLIILASYNIKERKEFTRLISHWIGGLRSEVL
jgi:hypothetical protein